MRTMEIEIEVGYSARCAPACSTDEPTSVAVACVCVCVYNYFTCFDFDSNEQREEHETFSQHSAAIMRSDELISHGNRNDEDLSALQVTIALIIQHCGRISQNLADIQTPKCRSHHNLVNKNSGRKEFATFVASAERQLFAARKFFFL